MITNKTKSAATQQNFTQFELLNALYSSKIFEKVALTPITKLVLYALVHHFNPQKEDMYPSQKYIAQSLGVSEKSVERSIKELAGARLIMYVTKTVNRYKFTQTFFDLVKLSDKYSQIVQSSHRQIVGQTNKREQIKNNVSSFSSKKDFCPQNQGRKVSSVQQTQQLLAKMQDEKEKSVSPVDFDREQAKKWLDSLLPALHGGILAQQVYKKYGFKMDEKVKQILIQRGKLPQKK